MPRYKFNPLVDRNEVEQFGFVNLRESYEKGIIPSTAQITDESFNGVGAPGLLLPHAQDVFESMRQVNYVRQRLDAARSKEAHELAEKSVESPSTE